MRSPRACTAARTTAQIARCDMALAADCADCSGSEKGSACALTHAQFSRTKLIVVGTEVRVTAASTPEARQHPIIMVRYTPRSKPGRILRHAVYDKTKPRGQSTRASGTRAGLE